MMKELEIRQLGPQDEAGLEAWSGEPKNWHSFVWTEGMTHEAHVQKLSDDFHGRNLIGDRVPNTMLYGFLDGVIVGRCSVRHRLNDFLKEWGGHIGYGVAPPFRQNGYGRQLLRAGLEHLKELGETKAFMTCATDNDASRKMIESVGGVLKDEMLDPTDGKLTFRFWVPLG